MTTPIAPLTAEERELMAHACAWDHPRSPGFRNHYVPGGEDVAICEALTARRLMCQTQAPGPLSGGAPVYAVTDAGKAALGPSRAPRPSMSNFFASVRECMSDNGMTFGDAVRWIRNCEGGR